MDLTLITSVFGFFTRQQFAFRINLLRKALDNYFLTTTQQFQSIYIVALGATPAQVGLMNGLGGIVSSILALPAGWFANSRGVKEVLEYGTISMAIGALLLAASQNWWLTIPAVVLVTVSTKINGVACPMVCGTCLKTEERATGMQLCDSISAVPKLIAPIVAAYLIAISGGLNAKGISTLYYLQSAGYLLITILILKIFVNPAGMAIKNQGGGLHFLSGVNELFKQGTKLKTWLTYSCLGDFPMYVIPIFWPLYARTVKGANEVTIGYMAMLMSIFPLLLAIPVGRIADTIGRKRVLYATTLLYAASLLSFVYASSQIGLMISALFMGLQMLMMVTRSTMNIERVPTQHLGTWMGVVNLVRGLFGMTIAPSVGGLIWEYIGPSYVWYWIVALMIASLTLLAAIPETMKKN